MPTLSMGKSRSVCRTLYDIKLPFYDNQKPQIRRAIIRQVEMFNWFFRLYFSDLDATNFLECFCNFECGCVGLFFFRIKLGDARFRDLKLLRKRSIFLRPFFEFWLTDDKIEMDRKIPIILKKVSCACPS